MNDYNFKISLTPIEDYFFGGERTFGDLTDKEGRNYFAYSNQYPQQSSLLGLLRYWLLVCNDCLPLEKNKQTANSLIGEESFSPLVSGKAQSFGVIRRMSPLLLESGKTIYRFAHGLANHQVHWQPNVNCYVAGTRSGFVPRITGFEPKEEYPMLLIDENGVSLAIGEIIKDHTQVGIKKGSEEQGFFKQTFYRLKKGAKFVVYVHIDPKFASKDGLLPTKLQNHILFFGGEQRQFQIDVAPYSEETRYPFGQTGTGDKITLLSDALVSSEIFQHCEFALSDSQEFRVGFFKSNGFGFGGKSQKFNLLKRGSVLFAKNHSAGVQIKGLLEEPVNFRQMGFNHYFQEVYHKNDGKNQ